MLKRPTFATNCDRSKSIHYLITEHNNTIIIGAIVRLYPASQWRCPSVREIFHFLKIYSDKNILKYTVSSQNYLIHYNLIVINQK